MSEAAPERSWHLGAVSASRTASGVWGIEIGDPISDEEYASHESSAGLLTGTFSDSPFNALQKRYNEYKDTVEEVAQAFEEKRATPDMPQLIAARTDDLLTALRRYADRTAHALSKRYGEESPEYSTFIDALRYEFDNTFAYRFAYHLRNYSDHRGSVPFHIKDESTSSPDGSVQRIFRVVLNSAALLEEHEWHSKVRSDLERINGDFSLDAVADGIQLSCMRAYCKMVLAQEIVIVEAVRNIRDFAARTNCLENYGPVFIEAPLDAQRSLGTMTFSPVRIEMADVAETALEQARTIAI
jgi:hypothetical protein